MKNRYSFYWSWIILIGSSILLGFLVDVQYALFFLFCVPLATHLIRLRSAKQQIVPSEDQALWLKELAIHGREFSNQSVFYLVDSLAMQAYSEHISLLPGQKRYIAIPRDWPSMMSAKIFSDLFIVKTVNEKKILLRLLITALASIPVFMIVLLAPIFLPIPKLFFISWALLCLAAAYRSFYSKAFGAKVSLAVGFLRHPDLRSRRYLLRYYRKHYGSLKPRDRRILRDVAHVGVVAASFGPHRAAQAFVILVTIISCFFATQHKVNESSQMSSKSTDIPIDKADK